MALLADPQSVEREVAVSRSLQRAAARYAKGDLNGALDLIQKALSEWPGHRRALEYLGWVRRCIRLRESAPLAHEAEIPLDTQEKEQPVVQSLAYQEEEDPDLLLDLPVEEVQPTETTPVPSSHSDSGDNEIALDMDVGDGLLDFVLAAEESTHAEDPSQEEVQVLASLSSGSGEQLLDLDEEPAEEPARVAATSGLTAFFSTEPEVPAAPNSGLSTFFSDIPEVEKEQTPESGLSSFFSDTPEVDGEGSSLSDIFSSAPPPSSPPPPNAGELSEIFSTVPLLEDESYVEPEVLFVEPEPQPAHTSQVESFEDQVVEETPLAEDEDAIFVDIHIPEETTDLPILPGVEAEREPDADEIDIEHEIEIHSEPSPQPEDKPASPHSFPPPPAPKPDLEALLIAAQTALMRGNKDLAFAKAEELFEHASPNASALSAYQMRLAGLYEEILAPLDRLAESAPLPVDLEPASAFLLSLLDGMMTLEDALTVAGMDRLRGARAMVHLHRRGLIKFI